MCKFQVNRSSSSWAGSFQPIPVTICRKTKTPKKTLFLKSMIWIFYIINDFKSYILSVNLKWIGQQLFEIWAIKWILRKVKSAFLSTWRFSVSVIIKIKFRNVYNIIGLIGLQIVFKFQVNLSNSFFEKNGCDRYTNTHTDTHTDS